MEESNDIIYLKDFPIHRKNQLNKFTKSKKK